MGIFCTLTKTETKNWILEWSFSLVQFENTDLGAVTYLDAPNFRKLFLWYITTKIVIKSSQQSLLL